MESVGQALERVAAVRGRSRPGPSGTPLYRAAQCGREPLKLTGRTKRLEQDEEPHEGAAGAIRLRLEGQGGTAQLRGHEMPPRYVGAWAGGWRPRRGYRPLWGPRISDFSRPGRPFVVHPSRRPFCLPSRGRVLAMWT